MDVPLENKSSATVWKAAGAVAVAPSGIMYGFKRFMFGGPRGPPHYGSGWLPIRAALVTAASTAVCWKFMVGDHLLDDTNKNPSVFMRHIGAAMMVPIGTVGLSGVIPALFGSVFGTVRDAKRPSSPLKTRLMHLGSFPLMHFPVLAFAVPIAFVAGLVTYPPYSVLIYDSLR